MSLLTRSQSSLFGLHAEDVPSRSPLDRAFLVNINKRLTDDWGRVRCRWGKYPL